MYLKTQDASGRLLYQNILQGDYPESSVSSGLLVAFLSDRHRRKNQIMIAKNTLLRKLHGSIFVRQTPTLKSDWSRQRVGWEVINIKSIPLAWENENTWFKEKSSFRWTYSSLHSRLQPCWSIGAWQRYEWIRPADTLPGDRRWLHRFRWFPKNRDRRIAGISLGKR